MSNRQLNLPHFLFLNGPPGSGKSTLAKMICEAEPSAWRESFAEPIRQMVLSVFFPECDPFAPPIDLRAQEVKNSWLIDLANIRDSICRAEDAPSAITIRGVMIEFSEQFMKPRFGSDIFGRLCFKRCIEQTLFYQHFVIDDSGFEDEAKYIIQKVGAANCHLVRLHRSGCNFSSDSRGYISLAGVQTLDLQNNGHPSEMMDTLFIELNGKAPLDPDLQSL